MPGIVDIETSLAVMPGNVLDVLHLRAIVHKQIVLEVYADAERKKRKCAVIGADLIDPPTVPGLSLIIFDNLIKI